MSGIPTSRAAAVWSSGGLSQIKEQYALSRQLMQMAEALSIDKDLLYRAERACAEARELVEWTRDLQTKGCRLAEEIASGSLRREHRVRRPGSHLTDLHQGEGA